MAATVSERKSLDDKYTVINGANWARVDGDLTPSELRIIAARVENSYKQVPKKK